MLLFFGCLFFLFVLQATLKKENTKASVGSVTYYQKVTSGISTGRYQVNGIQAFCIQYHKNPAPKGTAIAAITESGNEMLRKALYYGYGGPGTVLDTSDNAWVQTAIAASCAYNGVETHGNYAKREFYRSLAARANTPSNFRVYIAETEPSNVQNLAYYTYQPQGTLTLIKTSRQTEVTANNSCYSLNGATYGVYVDAACTAAVGSLVTGSNASSAALTLPAGIYYVKEMTPPTGYAISGDVQTVTITDKVASTVIFSDVPQMNPVAMLLQKVDSKTKTAYPEGKAVLFDAEYEVKFYAGQWSSNPEDAGITPIRTWVFKTDEAGQIYYSSECCISGDALFYNLAGLPALPLGTITIKEIKAPEGYLLNSEVVVRHITSSGNEESVYTYQVPTVEDKAKPKPYSLCIYKTNEFGQSLAGAEFALFLDESCTQEYGKGLTDEEGKLVFRDLQVETTYYLLELAAPDGYRLPKDEFGNEVVHEIYEQDTPKSEMKEITITNETGKRLPETGSKTIVPMLTTGVCMCVYSMKTRKKKER